MYNTIQVLEAGGKLSGDGSFLLRSLAAVMTRSRTKSTQVTPKLTYLLSVLRIRIRIRGSISTRYGSGSGSFYHKAKIV
jgi:hypothetical protein